MDSNLQKLRAIIEASKKLTSTLDLDELLNIILDVALKELEAERGTVFIRENNSQEMFSRILRGDKIKEIHVKFGEGIAGSVAETCETIIIDDAYSDERFNPAFDKKSGFKTRSILCTPLMDGENVVGVLQLLNKQNGETFTNADAEYISALAAHIVIAINNAKLHKNMIEQEKTRKELELASTIQHSLLPEQMPKLLSLTLNSLYKPCRTIGGDLYDYFELPNDHLGIVLADVSGKGIPAAMITSALHAYMHALIANYINPVKFCSDLNKLVCCSTPGSSYLTMVFIDYDMKSHTGKYCNCGHLPVLIKRNGIIDKLQPTSPVVGLLKDIDYADSEFALNSEEILFLYTDGLTEMSPDHEDDENEDPLEFGLESICQIISKENIDSGKMIDKIYDEAKTFSQDASQRDDITLLALQRIGAR